MSPPTTDPTMIPRSVYFDMAIHEWMAIAKGDRRLPEPFERFIALWETFNCIYRMTSRSDGERTAIEEIAGDPLVKETWKRLLRNGGFGAKVELLKGNGQILEIRGAGRGPRPPAEIVDPKNLQQVLLYIYRIRCNLFHGGKQPNFVGDTRLTTLARDVLLPLVEEILKSEPPPP